MTRSRVLVLGAVLAAAAIVFIVLTLFGDNDAGALTATPHLSGARGVSELHYQVSGPGVSRAGTVPVGKPLQLKDLPPGPGYKLELAGASPDETIKCARQDGFAITAGETTVLALPIFCRDLGNIARFVMSRRPGGQPAPAAAEPPPAVDVPPECSECEKAHIANGNCEADSGCDRLEGEDKRLCINLVNCMRATNCWVKDPLDCLCGTVDYVECTTHANGACLAEMQAATKSTDPVKNGTLFYDPSVPAGVANRLISCDKEMCRDHCAMP
jgi:hypothetical protein